MDKNIIFIIGHCHLKYDLLAKFFNNFNNLTFFDYKSRPSHFTYKFKRKFRYWCNKESLYTNLHTAEDIFNNDHTFIFRSSPEPEETFETLEYFNESHSSKLRVVYLTTNYYNTLTSDYINCCDSWYCNPIDTENIVRYTKETDRQVLEYQRRFDLLPEYIQKVKYRIEDLGNDVICGNLMKDLNITPDNYSVFQHLYRPTGQTIGEYIDIHFNKIKPIIRYYIKTSMKVDGYEI